MADFPDDLISEILLRLSVKSLLRFRFLSKTWCALIDNNTFVKRHLNHSTQTNNKPKLVFSNCYNLYSLGPYSLTDQPLKLDQPVNPTNLPTNMILGSCNGLLCILYDHCWNRIMLWNRATRKHLKLLVAKPPNFYAIRYGFGFGYDSVLDDYKVVIIYKFLNNDDINYFVTETNVYSLRSNSWRIIKDKTHYLIDGQGPGALVCSALHWIGQKTSNSHMVIAFDLATEKHKILSLPYLSHGKILSTLVSELGGCLSIVCHNNGIVDVWVMKDYGVRESWTKLLTLPNLVIGRSIGALIPLAYSESGDGVLLVVNSAKLLCYNLEMRTSEFVEISGINRVFYPVVCLESLVSLGEKAENDEKQGGEIERAKEEHKEEDSSLCSRQVD